MLPVRKEWVVWVALAVGIMILYPFVLGSEWSGNSDIHSVMEFTSAIIALLSSCIVLVHFFAKGNMFYLFISLGFVLQGSEDLIHAIFSFSRIWPAENPAISKFVPGTYVSGRLLLVACLFLGFFFRAKVVEHRERFKQAVLYNASGFLLASSLTFLVAYSPLPEFILPGKIISRPVDFLTALLYLGAMVLFVRFYLQEGKGTPFLMSMTVSILLGLLAQVYMIHSQGLYDAQFEVAHILKILSLVAPIFGICIGIFYMYRKEEEISRDLGLALEKEKQISLSEKEAVAELKEKSQEIEKANEDLLFMTSTLEKSQKELQGKVDELQKFYDTSIDREYRIAQLKKEVEKLRKGHA